MIDLHCHILPGIDDGPRTMEESLEMARKAVADGITTIVCTPHYTLRYPNTKEIIELEVKHLQQVLTEHQIPLTVTAGQEVHLTGELIHQLETGKIQFLDAGERYFLLEFPEYEVPFYAATLIEKVLHRGQQPIIVHPECNAGFIKDPNKLISFIEMGVLTQLTAPSLVGIYGEKIQQTARKMLDHDLIHMLASDAHRRQDRDFYLKEAYEWIGEKKGVEKVQGLQETAAKMLAGEDVPHRRWRRISKNKFWFLS